MNNKIVLITDQEMKNAVSLKEYMKEAWQETHTALDRLIVMTAYIKRFRRDSGIEHEIEAIDGIEKMRDEASNCIGNAQFIYSQILRKMESVES